MIKATELRLRNRILDPFGREAVVDKLVINYTYGTVALSAIDKGYQFESFICDNCNPIPLTEEMLVRMGFKSFCKDWSKKGIIIHARKRGFVVNKKIPILNYVHQLQNLYWCLCGEELQIKEANNE